MHNYHDGMTPPVIKPKTVILEGTSQKIQVNIGKGAVTITAAIETKAKNDQGVIFANGGLLGGTSLYIKGGKLRYTINDGVKEKTLASSKPVLVGKNTIRIEFTETRSLILYLNNKKVAEEKNVSHSRYLSSASSEGISVGKDSNSPVTKSYLWPFGFSGRVTGIVIEQHVE